MPGNPRRPILEVNSTQRDGCSPFAPVSASGRCPISCSAEDEEFVRLLPDVKAPKVDVYFVYPEELRNSKRVAVFRDFLLARLAERA